MKGALKFTPKVHTSRPTGVLTQERNLINVLGRAAHGDLLAQMNLQDTTENTLVQSHSNALTVTGAFQGQITCHFIWSGTELVSKMTSQKITFEWKLLWWPPSCLAVWNSSVPHHVTSEKNLHCLLILAILLSPNWSRNVCQICKYGKVLYCRRQWRLCILWIWVYLLVLAIAVNK